MAFATIAAAVTANTAITATMIFAAVAEVGTILTVVGAVTGDEELMKIGGTIGLIGGVGGLASGAMGLGASAADAAATTVTDAATASSNVANSLDGFESLADATTSGLSDAATVGNPIATNSVAGSALPEVAPLPATDAVQQVAQPTQAAASAPVAADPIAVSAPSVNGSPASMDVQSPATSGTPYTSPTGSTGSVPGGSGVDGYQGNNLSSYSSATPSQNSNSFFGQIKDFMKDPGNKALVDTGMKFGLGAVQGAASGQFNQARVDLARQQQNWGNSVGNTSRTTGIINGARA